jgi:NitT/TauT family transport system substrate-binding protein
MKTKKALAILSAVALTAGLSACARNDAPAASPPASAQTAADEYVVKIANATALCYAPLHAAIEQGFFEREGLKYEATVLDTAATIDAAASGAVDVGMGLIGRFAQPLENGLGVKLTAGLHSGCIKIVTAGDSPIDSVAGLKGKKIGVASLTDSPAVTVKLAASREGIGVTPDNMELELLVFQNSDLPVALQNGSIDAYAAMDPGVSVAARDNNLKVLADTAQSEGFKDDFCCASFVTDAFLKAHPALAKKYTDAFVKAALWVGENPEETAKLQVEKNYVAGDAEFNASLLKNFSFRASESGGLASLTKTLTELQSIGVLNKATDVAALAKKAYLEG